jgi:hypothetical protein
VLPQELLPVDVACCMLNVSCKLSNAHDRDLNAAKNILSSRIKNYQSHSREIRRKRS